MADPKRLRAMRARMNSSRAKHRRIQPETTEELKVISAGTIQGRPTWCAHQVPVGEHDCAVFEADLRRARAEMLDAYRAVVRGEI